LGSKSGVSTQSNKMLRTYKHRNHELKNNKQKNKNGITTREICRVRTGHSHI
jgi:hypothetical protein